MQPLQPLLPAIYAALLGLEYEGVTVPVYQPQLPNDEHPDRYVLIGQPTANRAGGSRACRIWSCTVLLDCVTVFAPGETSSIPADAIASLVCDRLDGATLLVPGYQAGEATAEAVLSGTDFDGEEADVHRYVRMRFPLYEHLGAGNPVAQVPDEAIYYETLVPVQAEAGPVLTYETYESSLLTS